MPYLFQRIRIYFSRLTMKQDTSNFYILKALLVGIHNYTSNDSHLEKKKTIRVFFHMHSYFRCWHTVFNWMETSYSYIIHVYDYISFAIKTKEPICYLTSQSWLHKWIVTYKTHCIICILWKLLVIAWLHDVMHI